MMKVNDIVKKFLDDNGFDGLFREGECFCFKEDLIPWETMDGECQAGVRVYCKDCTEREYCEYLATNPGVVCCIKEKKEEDIPKTQCPKCGKWIEDFDGFGVLYHPECGHCEHASSQGNEDGEYICDYCGKVVK